MAPHTAAVCGAITERSIASFVTDDASPTPFIGQLPTSGDMSTVVATITVGMSCAP